jgi:hypothetical protein
LSTATVSREHQEDAARRFLEQQSDGSGIAIEFGRKNENEK